VGMPPRASRARVDTRSPSPPRLVTPIQGVVSTTKTAFEAGAAIETLKPAVLVVDVSLPDVRAEQLRKDLRAHDGLESLKLIAMSADMTEAEGQTMLQAGFDAFLKKPFQFRQVIEAIEQATNIVQ